MDICRPNWTQNSSIYSGRLESPPPSQYKPSLFSSRNGYGQSKRTTTETPKEPEKHQHMSEDEEKQFVLQKNGKYTLVLSKYKNMVLSVFKGNVYCHIWNNKNKMHVSLNLDELAYMLKNKTVIQDIMEQLLIPNVEKKFPNFPFEMQKNGTYALTLSNDKKMVLSLFNGNVYCHIWNNKNQKHVSLNSNELMYILSNEANIHYVTELLSK